MSQKHIIATWIILLSVFPGLLGQGTIIHYCNTCNSSPKKETLHLSYNINEIHFCGCFTTECSLKSEIFASPSEKKPCQSELANVKPVLTHVQTEELLPFLIEIDLLFNFYVFSYLHIEDTYNHFSSSGTQLHSSFSSSQGALKQSVFGTFLL
ncbi:hypothetical protein DDZ16_16970 [Marinilabilia rubra]|uniref:Uncharacterized protein n=2 Tax=Marinilabilia rubra TaxID=2162893 RepID=A0A2U2B572_9BACT|nr:hypothetical protein DDZ16_16970 [Marinilabilia rubra]